MKRLPNEDFEAYKKRRRLEKVRIKRHVKGSLAWNSDGKRRDKSKTYKKPTS